MVLKIYESLLQSIVHTIKAISLKNVPIVLNYVRRSSCLENCRILFLTVPMIC